MGALYAHRRHARNGLRVRYPHSAGHEEKASRGVALDFDPNSSIGIDRLIDAWLPLTFAVNSIVRCMGESDFYPFVLSPRAVTKLGFIHELIHRQA